MATVDRENTHGGAIVTIHVGQCGVQIGNAVWDQFCAENRVWHNGTRLKNKKEGAVPASLHKFFDETQVQTSPFFFASGQNFELTSEAV